MSSIQCTRSFRYGSSKYRGTFRKVEDETVQWCKEIMKHSPTALRFLKAAMNADTDGLAGLQQMAGDATLLYYTTDEAKEGRDAFKEKRDPDFDQFPKFHKLF